VVLGGFEPYSPGERRTTYTPSFRFKIFIDSPEMAFRLQTIFVKACLDSLNIGQKTVYGCILTRKISPFQCGDD